MRYIPRNTFGRSAGLRAIPLLAAGSAFAGFAALWLTGFRAEYARLLHWLGVVAFRFPFVDASGVLAAIQCRREGIDVYRVNPCDVLGRVHVYSPLWLRADILPVTTHWTPWVGLGLVAIFLLSLLLLPPSRTARGATLMALASASPPVLFAMERGNIDLVIFALAVLAAAGISQRGKAGWLGYAAAVLSAALKYYPLVLLVLALRERPARCIRILAIATLVLGVALLCDLDAVLITLRHVPAPDPFGAVFGATDLPDGLAQVFGWPQGRAVGLLAVLSALAVTTALLSAHRLRPALASLPDDASALLTAGAALIAGCFFAARNIDYRAIHLLLLLPGLLALSRRAGDGRGLAKGAVAAVLFALWTSPARQPVLWMLNELCWWWLVTMCLAVLWVAVWDSQLLRLCRMMPARALIAGASRRRSVAR